MTKGGGPDEDHFSWTRLKDRRKLELDFDGSHTETG